MRPPQPPQRRITRKLQLMSAIFVAGTLQSQGFFGRVPVGGISAEFRAHRGPNFIRQSAGRHPPKRVHLENEYILTADLRVSLGSGVSFCYSVHRSPDLNTFFEARVDPKRCGPSDRTPPLGVSARQARYSTAPRSCFWNVLPFWVHRLDPPNQGPVSLQRCDLKALTLT